jgi:hypothetical protein
LENGVIVKRVSGWISEDGPMGCFAGGVLGGDLVVKAPSHVRSAADENQEYWNYQGELDEGLPPKPRSPPDPA